MKFSVLFAWFTLRLVVMTVAQCIGAGAKSIVLQKTMASLGSRVAEFLVGIFSVFTLASLIAFSIGTFSFSALCLLAALFVIGCDHVDNRDLLKMDAEMWAMLCATHPGLNEWFDAQDDV